ncbi:YkgJ family cysteine cluster protein [Chloroflexota bacterium]
MEGNIQKTAENNCPKAESGVEIRCFRCGLCCVEFQAILTDEDIIRLAESLALSREDFISDYVQATLAGYLLRHTRDGCIFLKWEDNKTFTSCTVHPFRPECCGDWKAGLFQKQCRDGLERLKQPDKLSDIKADILPGK